MEIEKPRNCTLFVQLHTGRLCCFSTVIYSIDLLHDHLFFGPPDVAELNGCRSLIHVLQAQLITSQLLLYHGSQKQPRIRKSRNPKNSQLKLSPNKDPSQLFRYNQLQAPI